MRPGMEDADSKHLPVVAFTRYVEPGSESDSLLVSAQDLAERGIPVLPIVSCHTLVGAVSEAELAKAWREGLPRTAPVSLAMDRHPPLLSPDASREQALEVCAERGWAVVVDERNELIGIVTPSLLLAGSGTRELRGKVGGMATPFGVYLTNGIVSGGASPWALFATGALLSFVMHLTGTAVFALGHLLPPKTQNLASTGVLANGLWMVLFLLAIRFAPLSGTHGAEHMVVHALENGEELVPETVGRMSRIHPRCGTNLAVAVSLFLGIMSIERIPDHSLRLLLATLVTLILWRPIGHLLQQFVTTSQPTTQQLADGIKAGTDLLGNMQLARTARPSILHKLVKSGLFQVMGGGAAVALLFALAYEVLKVPLDWRVS